MDGKSELLGTKRRVKEIESNSASTDVHGKNKMTVILSTENIEKTEKKLKVADIDKDDVKVILWKMKESECISLGENNAWEKVKVNVISLGQNHD